MNRLPHVICIAVTICVSAIAGAENMATSAIDTAVQAGFNDLERQIIEKYIGKLPSTQYETGEVETSKKKKTKGKKAKGGLPAGLAKRDSLPPGLERQLQKNGTLPPGLAKRGLPTDLEKQLPPPPKGYERQIVEDAAIVLIHKATGKIADVIAGAITGD